MCLNHPQTITHPGSVEKLSSMKPAPGAKEVGDHYLKSTKVFECLAFLSNVIDAVKGDKKKKNMELAFIPLIFLKKENI